MASLFVQEASSRASSPLSNVPNSIIELSEASAALRTNLSPSTSSYTEPPHKKRRILKAEHTWEHFRNPVGSEPQYDEKKRRIHFCKRCPKWSTSISSNARYHLEKAHQIIVTEAPTRHEAKVQQAIGLSFRHAKEQASEKSKEKEMNILRNAIKHEAFLEAQCLLITRRRLPRNFVNWPEFHALLYAVNPISPEVTISANSTASTHIEKSYIRHRSTVKNILHQARSQIHFSFDLWTAPQSKSLLGIHVQWVDKDFRLRKALLGLPQLKFSHDGPHQAAYIMDVIRSFEIAHSTGYFVGDNAGSNGTCLYALSDSLRVEYGIKFDPVKRRIRCLGHIINLSLSAFLFADNKTALREAIKQSIEEEGDVTICELLIERLKETKGKKKKARGDHAGWRSIGALGKLHNIAVCIRGSSILSDYWGTLSPLMLGLDNATRWNSWYMLLKRAVQKRAEIELMCTKYIGELNGGDDILTQDEWQLLVDTEEFLQPFYEATLEGQNTFASLDQTLVFMDILFKHFEEAKVRNLHI
jgi:hypothetical protein